MFHNLELELQGVVALLQDGVVGGCSKVHEVGVGSMYVVSLDVGKAGRRLRTSLSPSSWSGEERGKVKFHQRRKK